MLRKSRTCVAVTIRPLAKKEIRPLARNDVDFTDLNCEAALRMRKYGRAIKVCALISKMSASPVNLERNSKLRMGSSLVVHCHGYSGLGLAGNQSEILRKVLRSSVKGSEFERRRNERETTRT